MKPLKEHEKVNCIDKKYDAIRMTGVTVNEMMVMMTYSTYDYGVFLNKEKAEAFAVLLTNIAHELES